MNAIKKNASLDTGWIIRPSKRFPGNYYYFNVRTGEAAWTLNDADIKNLKKDANMKKNTNHPDCEPDTPPEDTGNTALNTSTTKETINQGNENTQQQPHHMFGKAIFSEPLNITSDDMNNVRWAPVQFMIHTNIPMPYTNTPNTDLIDKHLVHASETPMSKRFKNFNDPAILFRKDNKPINDPESSIYECKENPIFDKEVPKSTDFGNGTSKCSFTVSTFGTYSNYKMDIMPTHSEFEMTSPKRPEGSKSSEGSNFETSTPKSDMTGKPIDFEFGIKKSMMIKDSGFEMNESNNAHEESTLYGYNRAEYECKNLDRHDLRHLLISKRKQIEDASKIRSKKSKLSTNVTDENTKSNPKTPTKRIMIDDHDNTPNKKVTFNDNPILGRPKTKIFDYNNIPDCPKVVFHNEVPTAPKVIFVDNDPRKVTLDKDTDTRKVIFNKDDLKKVSWAKNNDTRKVILDKKIDSRYIFLDNNNDPKKITLQQETDPRKVTLQQEIDQRKITLQQENDPKKNTLQQENDPQKVTLQQENDPKQITLQQENEPKKVTLKQENDPRKVTLQQDNDPRKVTVQQENDPRKIILVKNNESRKVTWAKNDGTKNYISDKNDPKMVTLDKDDTLSYTEDIGVLSFSTKTATIEPRLKYDVPKTTTSHDKLQWCLVADSQVLLNYIEEIDKIVEADKTCRLLVPYAVRSLIADICTMECRGQQRVLNARQTMRRLEQVDRYKVEQLSDTTHTQTSALNTEDSIINCCVRARKDYFSVVLITNNPNLLSKAKSHSISCYTVFDILNGVEIKPNLISELKKIAVLVRNGSQATNFDSFPVHIYKKELFKNLPSNCDTQTYNDNIFLKSVTETATSELRQDANNIQLNVQNLPPQNENDDSEPLKSENLTTKLKVAESNLLNFDKDIKKLAFHSDTFNFYDDGGNAKSKQDTDIQKSNLSREIYNKIREELPFRNVENIKKIFDSTTQLTNLVSKENTDIKRKEIKNKSIFDPPSPSPKEIKDAKPKIATHTRAEKIIKMVNPSAVNTESKTKDIPFKIPQTPLKKNAPAESSDANDKFVPILNMAAIIDEKMKELKVKDSKVLDNLTLRIDEWICTYTQIMEDILNSILEFTNHKMRTTHHFLLEVIVIIKMAYKNHTGIAYIVDKLHNNIQNSTNTKGLLKPSIKPEEFIQIFGESVVLIQSLKTILPHFQNLSDAENNLQLLIENIEAKQQATEPELSNTPPVSTELEDTQTTRANFKKDLSYVKDYLKKHFKHWASHQGSECKEKDDNSRPDLPAKQSIEQPEEQDLKVFRTYGKHLNMLKINQNKEVFVDTKNLGETSKTVGPKIQNICDEKPTSDKCIDKDKEIKQVPSDEKCIDKDKEIVEVQSNEKIEIASTLHSHEDSAKEKYIEICDNTNDLPTNGNTLANIKETAGPKLIRNLKIIDEYEDKIRNRPTLDLDMLDYSEILESSINDLSEIYLTDVMKKNVSKECDKKGCEMITKKKCNETHKRNDENDKINLFMHKENINIQNVDNAFYATNNQTCATDNLNYATDNQNYATDNQNYAKENYYYVYSNTISSEEINHNTIPTHYNNNDAHNRNYATRNNENYAKIEDSDDSGFENESIYAQSLVKIFLSELSASFKVIYEFINKFMTNIHKNDFADETKLLLQDKAKNALDHIIAIIQSLKSIIRRESAEDTILKSLLHKAGIDCFNDKGIMGYREIVQKSLEQAQILEHALRIVVNATTDHVTPSVTSLSSTLILNSNT